MTQQKVHTAALSAAPPEVVWSLVSDVTTWTSWAPFQLAELERDGEGDPNGVGAIRRFRNGRYLTREEITAFVPGQRLAYRLLSGLPLRDYTATIVLDPAEPGTTIRWTATFRARIPGTGGLFRRGMQRLYDDFSARLVAAAGDAARSRRDIASVPSLASDLEAA